MYIRAPEDLHPEFRNGEIWFPAREIAELLRRPWPALRGRVGPGESKRVYRYRAGFRSTRELLISAPAAGDLMAMYWDQPHARWRAYVAALRPPP